MVTRKAPMLVRVSLANKIAPIVWVLMVRRGMYQAPAAVAQAPAAVGLLGRGRVKGEKWRDGQRDRIRTTSFAKTALSA